MFTFEFKWLFLSEVVDQVVATVSNSQVGTEDMQIESSRAIREVATAPHTQAAPDNELPILLQSQETKGCLGCHSSTACNGRCESRKNTIFRIGRGRGR